MKRIEYKVREVKRYIVTKYTESENGGSSETCGIFDREDEALRVGFALAKMDLEGPEKANVLFPEFPKGWAYHSKD